MLFKWVYPYILLGLFFLLCILSVLLCEWQKEMEMTEEKELRWVWKHVRGISSAPRTTVSGQWRCGERTES